MAFLLAAGFPGGAPVANAASAVQSVLKPGKNVRNNVIEISRRGRGPRIHLPIGPAYIYYDYPYYYGRGYYPTHIGGYVYYPNFSHSYHPGYSGRCSNWHRRCAASWVHHRGPESPRRQRARRIGAYR
jgi:hypothetical protein